MVFEWTEKALHVVADVVVDDKSVGSSCRYCFHSMILFWNQIRVDDWTYWTVGSPKKILKSKCRTNGEGERRFQSLMMILQ